MSSGESETDVVQGKTGFREVSKMCVTVQAAVKGCLKLSDLNTVSRATGSRGRHCALTYIPVDAERIKSTSIIRHSDTGPFS